MQQKSKISSVQTNNRSFTFNNSDSKSKLPLQEFFFFITILLSLRSVDYFWIQNHSHHSTLLLNGVI